MDIPILFQDEHIVVVDKPTDLAVHKNDFMAHDAPYLTKIVGEITGKWIHNVHRLDAKTSGIIILTFSTEAAHEFAQMFERKEIQKTYMAIVQGNPGIGMFDRKVLVKKKSKFKKPAITNFETMETVQTSISYKEKKDIVLSLVQVKPETGRWHQIRQHFAQHHHDILGDSHHGDFTLNKIVSADTGIRRLFLHASKLGFTHPFTHEQISLESVLPREFSEVLAFYR